jgi:hypothetical protein
MQPFTALRRTSNRVAKNALGGVGGLYRLRAGHETLDTATYATGVQTLTAFRMQTSTHGWTVVAEKHATLWADR